MARAEQQVLRRGQTQAAPQDDAIFETHSALQKQGIGKPTSAGTKSPTLIMPEEDATRVGAFGQGLSITPFERERH